MENKNKIPKRSEVDVKNTWAIQDLYATDELWNAEFESAKKLPSDALEYQGKLSDAKTLLAYLKMSDKASIMLNRLGNYAMRKSDEDTGNSKYRDMRGKVIGLFAEIGAALAFETPEILAIPDEVFEKMLTEEAGLALYERHLRKLRRMKEHILSEAEERLLAAASEIAGAPESISSTFKDADLKFPDITDENGNIHHLTQGSFVPLLESDNVDMRKRTFKAFYDVFAGYKNTTAACIDAQVKQLRFYANARKFGSTLEASLFDTEVPVSVYRNLITAVNDKLEYMHKYMRLRKKLMKLDELHMYDIYTPIVSEVDKKITFDEAKETVLRALAPLGENYLSVLKEGFSNRWIDVYENEGKRSGAYSSCGDPHPFVLLNHKDTLDSEFTLAHEMGHALHTYYSMKNQPKIYDDYVIFVAEVASTCNEVLLMKHLLSKTTDKKERAYLINYFLEQFRTTLYRQTMFAEFELEMNAASERGESLTADKLCDMYYELNHKYYGDDIVIDDEIRYEWERIPHFFYNYYVFQYATGFSAAVAIANRILSEGQNAVDDYLRFLSAGSSTDPISILKIAGVDMTTEKPITEALSLFNELIDEMDALMG